MPLKCSRRLRRSVSIGAKWQEWNCSMPRDARLSPNKISEVSKRRAQCTSKLTRVVIHQANKPNYMSRMTPTKWSRDPIWWWGTTAIITTGEERLATKRSSAGIGQGRKRNITGSLRIKCMTDITTGEIIAITTWSIGTRRGTGCTTSSTLSRCMQLTIPKWCSCTTARTECQCPSHQSSRLLASPPSHLSCSHTCSHRCKCSLPHLQCKCHFFRWQCRHSTVRYCNQGLITATPTILVDTLIFISFILSWYWINGSQIIAVDDHHSISDLDVLYGALELT